LSSPGCATNVWVTHSHRCPILIEIFPAVAHNTAAQCDNTVRSSDDPMHTRLPIHKLPAGEYHMTQISVIIA
jgi:hypothetical protein